MCTGPTNRRSTFSASSAGAFNAMAHCSSPSSALRHQMPDGNRFFVSTALACPGDRVPETVRDAVLARLMRGSAAARDLAELVSISPGKTERWLIAAMLGSHGEAMDEGVTRGLLSAHGDAVSFRHELARLAVYSTVAPERRREMHGRVLQALEQHHADPTQLVHHAALAENAAAVLKYAPLAAKEATRLGAHRQAAAHLSAALHYRDD